MWRYYGHHSIWQFLDTTLYTPIYTGDTAIHWRDALTAPVAGQMRHLKNLMESQKDFNRVEDSLLIASERGTYYKDLIIATKNASGTYALIYLPETKPVTVNTSRLQAGKKTARWFGTVSGKIIGAREKKHCTIANFYSTNCHA